MMTKRGIVLVAAASVASLGTLRAQVGNRWRVEVPGGDSTRWIQVFSPRYVFDGGRESRLGFTLLPTAVDRPLRVAFDVIGTARLGARWVGASTQVRWTPGSARAVWLDALGQVGAGQGSRQAVGFAAGATQGALAVEVRAARAEVTTAAFFDPDSGDGQRDPPKGGAFVAGGIGVSVRHTWPKVEVLGRVGFDVVRAGNDRPWLHGMMTIPLHSRAALIVGAGVRPSRPELGERPGRFVELGLELSSRARHASHPPPRIGLLTAKLDRDRWRLLLRYAGARQIEIKSDLTGWEPIPLERNGRRTGEWQVTLSARPGVYAVLVRVDGGEWEVPPGLVGIPDGFGGMAGLLELH